MGTDLLRMPDDRLQPEQSLDGAWASGRSQSAADLHANDLAQLRRDPRSFVGTTISAQAKKKPASGADAGLFYVGLFVGQTQKKFLSCCFY